ncbi:uncharacterized protein LOC114540132 [Dendronephthya gigantea]|uniref:uncharacterized protein LOC114540132 n=1 Tax=Dendronephthya gigantea TaxID=151771 RepID=UPI00106ADAA4|nr:uncharacterized protein LOC114540132 [Dendronephthya gigantea]
MSLDLYKHGDCNEFKAGEVDNMLRSKGRNKLFDEKGVFGRVCRHEYPKGFINMKHGERHSIAAQDAENHDAINDLVRKRRRTLKTVESMERKHHVIRRWKVGDVKYNTAVRSLEEDRKNRVLESLYSLAVERAFLLTLKKKYAVRHHIWCDRIEGLPSFLAFDDVKDPESYLFQDFKSIDDDENNVPFSVKRTVIDLHCLTERCKEEIELINIEVARLVKYHLVRKATFQEIVEKHNADHALHMRGLSCVMQKRAYEEENKLYLLRQTLSDSVLEVSSLPQHKYGFCNVIEYNSSDCGESCTKSVDHDSESDSECESDDDDVYELAASDEDDDDVLPP